MLGDTSMGMINGYFGPRLLNRHGFTEHKVDQAWIIDRGKRIDDKRIDAAFAFVQATAASTFHWGEAAPPTSTRTATREQLRDYLAVLDMVAEFKADCLGWQYQLGLIPLRPPSDFAEGLFNSPCRPESNGDTIACAPRPIRATLMPMEMMKRLLQGQGPAPGGDVPRRALGRRARRALRVGAAQLRLVRRLRLQPRSRARCKACTRYRQPARLLPDARRHVRRREPARQDHLGARVHRRRASSGWTSAAARWSSCRPPMRDAWWEGTTREWPFMAADLGIGRDTLMAHYLCNHVAVAYGDVFERWSRSAASSASAVRDPDRHDEA